MSLLALSSEWEDYSRGGKLSPHTLYTLQSFPRRNVPGTENVFCVKAHSVPAGELEEGGKHVVLHEQSSPPREKSEESCFQPERWCGGCRRLRRAHD